MGNKLLKKREIIALIALASVCAALLAVFSLSPKGNAAVVYFDGEEIKRIRLDRDAEYHIEAALPVTLEVVGGKIRFINSQCPDGLCEGFGLIGDEHEYAVCMPAKVVVMIEAPD